MPAVVKKKKSRDTVVDVPGKHYSGNLESGLDIFVAVKATPADGGQITPIAGFDSGTESAYGSDNTLLIK